MADKPRAKARRAAALTRPVVLKKDFQNEMSAADRIRYYLGLPQGYPMNPVLIQKARSKLHEKQGGQGGNLTSFESQVMFDIHSAASAQRQDERFEGYPGTAASMRSDAKESLLRQASDEEGRYSPMWNVQYALNRLYGELPSEFNPDLTQTTRSGPEVFPTQQAAEAHLQRSGFRDPGESLQQARQRVARSHDIYAEDRERLRQLWDAQAQEAARSGYTPGPGEPGVQSMPGDPPNPMTQRAREQFYPAGGPPHLRQRLEELRARRQKAARAKVKGR